MRIREKAIQYLSRAAADRSRGKYVICAVAPIVFFSVIFAIALGVYSLGELLKLPRILSPITTYASYPLLVIGLVLMLGSVSQFLISRGTPVPLSPPPKLVSQGFYRWVRNPMFGGLFIFIIGLGLWLGSIAMLFVFLPLLIAAATWEIKTIEEPELERRLGQEYCDYRRCTPMFFPRLWRMRAGKSTDK